MLSKRTRKLQSGLSLIEVLISVLVISIGLLGLGGLQLASLKGANNSHFRTSASLAATELADRMRLNPSAVANALYEGEVELASCTDSTVVKSCDGDNLCSSEEAAAYDLNRIACGRVLDGQRTGGVFYQLPNASLSVNCDGVPCALEVEHTIVIDWNEVDDDDEGTEAQIRSYELDFIP